MKIDINWLKSMNACGAGKAWFTAQTERDVALLCEKLLEEKHEDWANWLISRALKRRDKIRYAIFAAEQVIGIYESKYPDDDRPRKAIEAAKAYCDKPTKANKAAAAARAASAADAARAASAADAAYAAYAYAAADAAASAEAASAYAAYDAAYSAYAYAAAEIKPRIIRYGVGLMKGGAK